MMVELREVEPPLLHGERLRRYWVYRLWAADGTCLYVGQYGGVNPVAQRVYEHCSESWWDEAVRGDCF